eukprot:CAMPEP_0197196520 /NCGR_PEP_ID=MMETSP1423-20130617/32401_1 /TAXON_ID=476441 /ORGANISM="Pseudo-nitzschia heimii, Strain UNC1101" /LENGTH=500 /DNA_ID=CAMNT_0042650325 /DNA_START=107 /DNA_END=1610 /DNA_ORIENTATION=-
MIDLYELSPRSLLATVARMVEEDDEAIINTPSVEQAGGSDDGPSGLALAYAVYPRVTGVITIMSSTAMIIMAWDRRKFLFHRLVFAMAINQFAFGVAFVIGATAIPREASEYVGNLGTWGTCTVQGFVNYLCGRASFFYYCCFSIYSYAGVMCGFDRHKYQWCEKWIHGIAIGYPVIVAIYILSIQGYNPGYGKVDPRNRHRLSGDSGDLYTVHTGLQSGLRHLRPDQLPHKLEDFEEVECERGPKEAGNLFALLDWQLPVTLCVVVPTALMTVLYYKVKMLESTEEVGKARILESRTIAIQSSVYLSALYLTIFPIAISKGLKNYSQIDRDKLLISSVAAQIIYSLFSLFTMLVYRHFTIDPCKKRCGEPKAKSAKPIKTTRKGSITDHASSVFDPNEKQESSTPRSDACDIFNTGEQSSCNAAETSSTESPTILTDKPEEDDRPPAESPQSKPRYSFNIFDGTNATGAYAEFIHAADSDDELRDQDETDRWASIQKHM